MMVNESENEVVARRERELRQTAAKIDLESTFALLDKLTAFQKGEIVSAIPTINGLEIEFRKTDRAFEFSTGPINSVRAPVIYQKSYYGLSKPFDIKWGNTLLRVKDGAGKAAIHMGKGFSTSGQLYDLDGITTQEPTYFRAIMPATPTMQTPVRYMLGKHFEVGTALRAFGLIKLTIRGNDFQFYDYHKGKQRYIFLESIMPVSMTEFRLALDSVIFVYGFISGALLMNERFVVQSADAGFQTISSFEFSRQQDSIDSPVELISPRLHKECLSLPKTIYLEESIFNTLIELCLHDKHLLRAVKLITQARGVLPEIEAASHCVALEIVKSIILEANAAKVRPIQDQTVADELKKRFADAANSFPDSAFNGKERLLRKINSINQPGNTEGFILAFEEMGISLTKEEKDYLGSRNKFLHGDIAFKDEDDGDPHQFKLHKVSLHIQLLTSCLILKLAGYNGAVKNFWKYWEIQRGENKNPTSLFKNI